MRPRSLDWVAGAVEGRLEGEDRVVTGAVVDSREARPGDLFVAIRGLRADGHDFVGDALARGAEGALVTRAVPGSGPQVIVEDVEAALLRLAKRERDELVGDLVGITGSSGKTSTKDLAAAVLAGRHQVVASPRSFNTEIGVPLTILRATRDTTVVVCEMGSRGLGHIAALAAVARPTIGIVTNVGVAHMEFFASPRAVADAKAELVEALPSSGTAILAADDPVVRDFDRRTSARVIRFGLSAGSDIRAEDVRLGKDGRAEFVLAAGDERSRVILPVPGDHMVQNALAAAGCGVVLGVPVEECASRLGSAEVSRWRMELVDLPGGLRLINDAYNANPASMAAALKTARTIAGSGRCLAVLGEMAELGSISVQEHERVGELLARLRFDGLVTVGERARIIAVGAVREGVEPDLVQACESVEEAIAAVRAMAHSGDVLLVKGSRAAGLERIAEGLLAAGRSGPAAETTGKRVS